MIDKTISLYCVTIILNLALFIESDSRVNCRDESNQPVDWFLGYKFPEIKHADKFKTGFAYAYLTNNISSQSDITWSISSKLIADDDSALMRTISVAYEDLGQINEAIGSVFYNDEPATEHGKTVSLSERDDKSRLNHQYAHSKGVLLLSIDTNEGIWLTHSVPKFPPARNQSLAWPSSSRNFGQTFMCLSFNLDKMGKQMVDHLINMRPLVYDFVASEHLLDALPNLALLEPNHSKKAVYNVQPILTQTFTTKQGQMLQLYSKSEDYEHDIYSDYIDKQIKSALYVETWRRGAGDPLNSSCPADNYHVNNVRCLRYDNNVKWSYLNDHSKWAISEEPEVGVVCISDTNRMRSQFRRGGGTVCLECSSCWSAFSNTILDLEPCPKI